MSKKQQLGNRFDDYGADKAPEVRTFGTGELDEDMFAALDSVPIKSETIGIHEIRADITQPRRIVPREVRGSWNGTATGVATLLDGWAEACGVSDDMVRAVLEGQSSVHGLAGDDPMLAGFVKLLDLASQIHDVGLQQRIGVSTVAGGYQIIYGERRWMAFQCLAHWVSDEYRAIPAKVASVSPWELAKIQAAENFQRDELNAIEKARQFAKLLIISRGDSDISYDPWEALVVEGGCDRPYYAQVADGNIHSIPYGMGSQFESALGISTGQMRKYRSLLKLTGDYEIDNALWILGDENDWAEGFMRDIATHVDARYIRGVIQTGVSIEKELRNAISESKRIADEKAKKEADAQRTVPVGTVLDESSPTTTPPPAGRERGLVQNADERVSQLPPNPVQNPTMNRESQSRLERLYLNKRVVMRDGRMGTVHEVRGDSLRVHFDDGATPWLAESSVELVHYTIPETPSPIEVNDADGIHAVPTVQEPSYLSDQVERMNEVVYEDDADTFVAPEYLDVSDNGHSVDGDLVDTQPKEVRITLTNLISLATQLGKAEEKEIIVNLFMANTKDVRNLSKMTDKESDAILSSYEAKVAHLLEDCMKNVERYTSRIREQVADARADGA